MAMIRWGRSILSGASVQAQPGQRRANGILPGMAPADRCLTVVAKVAACDVVLELLQIPDRQAVARENGVKEVV